MSRNRKPSGGKTREHPLIDNSDDLREFCNAQISADFVTVDTEFMRDSTYWPKLCLIQVAGPESAAAIDPLAENLDWGPFFDLLEKPEILKVFHSARQDLEIFFHWTGRLPAPLFDTQVAAMVCGFGDSVGYETLARRLAGARIDKSTRFADWSRRPLSARQREYAMSDVTHLRPVYEKLKARLVKSGRAHWLEEEMAILSNPKTYDLDPSRAWRRLKSNSSDRRYLAALRGLAEWRETEAQRRDVPRNRVLRDEQLYNIAAQRPGSADALARCRGFREDLARGRIGGAILKAIAEVEALPEEALPSAPQKSDRRNGTTALTDLLKVLLKARCESHGVAQKLVAASDELERIAHDNDIHEGNLGDDPPTALVGWRFEVIGRDALALKSGRIALTVRGDQLAIVAPGAKTD